MIFTLLLSLAAVPTADPIPLAQVAANPTQIRLSGADDRLRVLVDGETANGWKVDLTREAAWKSMDETVAEIADGVVRPIADGKTTLEATVHGRQIVVPVTVEGAAERPRMNFENDIVPLLNKFACNGSGCHGKAEGQNGFKLSVFGFDPPADYQAIVLEGRGRRVFPAAAERSLLLRKIDGRTPHGGGVRLTPDRPEYQTLREWIAAGLPRGSADDPVVKAIEITPRERRMTMKQSQQLRVIAIRSDGSRRDVTELATFQSNRDGLASVTESGLVTTGDSPGTVAVMATYMGQVDVFRVTIPRPDSESPATAVVETNFIDPLVHRQLRALNVHPSVPAGDAEFLRRVYLDVIGTLPTPAETREFLADSRPDKRTRLVESLLQRPEFADFWALKWADLLRVDRQKLGHKGAYQYYQWIRTTFAENRSLDRFAREILTADGLLADAPAGQFYRSVTDPKEMASTYSQVFLGVRIECAQCHHHPYDRWGQDDYFGMVAHFTQVGFKKLPRGETLVSGAGGKTVHPRDGREIFAHPLDAPMPEKSPDGNRRRLLADWVTSPENPFFARNLANRTWAHFLGRGLVEPVDDVRLTNPPSNPELLDALARHLVDNKFDFRQLVRAITASATYQRSSSPNESNREDEQNYSRYPLKRLGAEVLLDAICQATGVEEKFPGTPSGGRAIQLWDSRVGHDFLKMFGRPTRQTACECERITEPTVGQVLHVLNSPRVQEKLSHEAGRVACLLRETADDNRLIEELYLAFFSRLPTDEERVAAREYLAGKPNRKQAAEDLAWTMLNSLEFLFNH